MAGFLETRVIREFVAPQDVSTLNVLFPFTDDLGQRLEGLYFVGVNVGSVPVQFTLECSEDGVNLTGEPVVKQAEAGKQVEFAIEGARLLATKWRFSAQTIDPFPVTQVKWRIKGQQRPYT